MSPHSRAIAGATAAAIVLALGACHGSAPKKDASPSPSPSTPPASTSSPAPTTAPPVSSPTPGGAVTSPTLGGVVTSPSPGGAATPGASPEPEASPSPEQTIVMNKPGSRRALLYTWRDGFPRELPAGKGEPAWVLADTDYIDTGDGGNAWSLKFVVPNTDRAQVVAVVEYASVSLASERYDTSARGLEARGTVRPLVCPRTDHACAAALPADATGKTPGVAVALHGRYLIAFKRSDADTVDAEGVKTILDSLLACVEPAATAPGETAPVVTPSTDQGSRPPKSGG